MLNFNLYRDTVEFDDIPYIERSSDKIFIMILEDASGNRQDFSECLNNDIVQCAVYLINNGFLRGTTFDRDTACWSKITRKGEYLLEHIKEQDNLRNFT